MKLLSSLFGSRDVKSEVDAVSRVAAPAEVAIAGADPFPIAAHLYGHEGLPILDWQAAQGWLSGLASEKDRMVARTECQRVWLLHLRDALGYELHESSQCFVLAPYDGKAAQVMLKFVARTRDRIASVLDGIAQSRREEKEILIVFADHDTYYRYVSHAYPDSGTFAFSSGMFLHAGCPHFVTMHDEVHVTERVISHEMTHASVAHLRIPLWLNEGIAVNTEDRLMGRTPKLFTPAELREKHLAFWGKDEIQEFWSGQSFHRPDDGSTLSYDLAQMLIEIFAADWPSFRAFVQSADYEDSGYAAALEHLQVDLGESMASLLNQPSAEGWRPDPEKWHGDVAHEPE
jgi:hypothetical protein